VRSPRLWFYGSFDFNLGINVSFVDPLAKSYEKLSPDEVLVSKEKLKYQNFATGSGHILILSLLALVLDGVCIRRYYCRDFW